MDIYVVIIAHFLLGYRPSSPLLALGSIIAAINAAKKPLIPCYNDGEAAAESHLASASTLPLISGSARTDI